jgi:uncharacterized protein YbgA (DUF1722 family)/uncharacterized protein YbbK (DUF523 family)
MSPFETPRVVVSKCLGFEACRYNAQVIEDKFVARLEKHVKILDVCPEVEIGLGTPREPVRLVFEDNDVKMIQPDTGRDFTPKMKRFSKDYVASLKDIDGFILKSRSPSCGLQDAKVYPQREKAPAMEKGPGMFTKEVLDRFPNAAIEDEGRLNNFRIREHFLTKLFVLARFRKLKNKPTARGLVQFHSENKLLLMAYSQKELRQLGRIVANHEKRGMGDVFADYETHLSAALSRAARYTSHINVLMHALGYFSKELSSREKAHFLDLLEQYRKAKIPLSAINSVLRSWILRFDTEYLESQVYFEPYPAELVEITDSGKGRGKL